MGLVTLHLLWDQEVDPILLDLGGEYCNKHPTSQQGNNPLLQGTIIGHTLLQIRDRGDPVLQDGEDIHPCPV